ncbi:MAG TPA: hypothetical protein VMW73_16955 [Spirochaetia bacterium]|nr:hypothetical protein [Spirochaetia bacterium]
MKRFVLFALLMSAGSLLYALDQKAFDSVVDFNLNVQQIDTLVSQSKQGEIDPGKFLVLNGSVASIEVIRPAEKDYLALVELVTGKWTGLEKVNLYRVYLILSGPGFFKRMPAREPVNPPSDMIAVNDQIMVVGTYADVGQAPDGKNVAVIRGLEVRNMQ